MPGVSEEKKRKKETIHLILGLSIHPGGPSQMWVHDNNFHVDEGF